MLRATQQLSTVCHRLQILCDGMQILLEAALMQCVQQYRPCSINGYGTESVKLKLPQKITNEAKSRARSAQSQYVYGRVPFSNVERK